MSVVTTDVLVVGAGPAGTVAALRAAELGARTALVTSAAFGGMAANDGPVPVRTLAYAARLLSGAHQLERYGIMVGAPRLDYARLLARTREVIDDVREHSVLRAQIDQYGVVLHEHAGSARFVDPHHIETASGLRLQARKVILCPGGVNRRLDVPGSEHTNIVTDAFSLTSVPASMLVIGGGMTGLQVASIFNRFGTRVELFQKAARILPAEDEDVSKAMADAMRASGIVVHEGFGAIESFQKLDGGIEMTFGRDGERRRARAQLAVVAVGWIADRSGLNLAAAGVRTDEGGFIAVDDVMCTSVSHIYAAGDITGRWMLVPQSIHDGWVAATHAVRGSVDRLPEPVSPIGGFTEPEYARVGLTEAMARERHNVVVGLVHFDETTRTIIDGRKDGFCKLLVDRDTKLIAGCHVVGERAVEMVQVVAVAMAAGFAVDQLARIPLSFPTYTGILGRAAYRVMQQIEPAADISSFEV